MFMSQLKLKKQDFSLGFKILSQTHHAGIQIPSVWIANARAPCPSRMPALDKSTDADERKNHRRDPHPARSRYHILMSLAAITSLLAGSPVGDTCTPRSIVPDGTIFVQVFTAVSVLIVPCNMTLIGLWWRGSLDFLTAWAAFAGLKAVHLAAVAGAVACEDVRLPVYVGAAAGFPIASALVVLSVRGRIGGRGEAAGAGVLAVWFGVFAGVAWGVVKRDGLKSGSGRLASLVVLCVLAGVAVISAACEKDANGEEGSHES